MGQVNELKDFTRCQLDAALMKIGQDVGLGTADGIRAFLAGELVVSRRSHPPQSLRKENGIISFSVGPTDGTTGQEWIPRLKSANILIDVGAEVVLHSPRFWTTSGVVSDMVVIDGGIFGSRLLSSQDVYDYAKKFRTPDGRKLVMSKAEQACLIRELLTDQEIEAMGLRTLIVMHTPIENTRGELWQLCVARDGKAPLLSAWYTPLGSLTCSACGNGFVFGVEQA